QAGLAGVATTDANGQATFTYTGSAPGNAEIQATFMNSQGQTVLSNTVVSHWLQTNRPPSVSAGGPYTVAEGGSVTLTALGQDLDGDVIPFAWDLDNDGTLEAPGQAVTFSAAALDGPSSQTVRVRGDDGHGNVVISAGVVNVVNAPPTAAILG